MSLQHPGESLPLWQNAESMPKFSGLRSALEVDVCIVGGGIAGLTSAYLLLQEGLSVAILEASELASGQSGRTTAQFCTALDERYYVIESNHGQKGAILAAESHSQAIQKVIEIIRQEKIDCEHELINGYLFSPEKNGAQILERELQACKRAGLTHVHLLENSPLDSFHTRPVLCFPNQLQLHPVKYLRELANRIVSLGGKIFTQTRVVHVEGGEKAKVKTQQGFEVACKNIIVATNSPTNDLFAIHTKQAPYRTYVLAFRIPKDSVRTALYWDTLDPYHYVRIEKSGEDDILIVGGEDHKTGQDSQPQQHYINLEKWTRERFHPAGQVLYRWSGQVMEPVDGLAFLGHNPMDKNNVFIISGDSGNGMTHCTIGAMIITDQIMKRPNPWEALYKPSRISLSSSTEFIKENTNVAVQYADWITPKSEPDLAELASDEGCVFRDGIKMVAVYKDELGNLDFMNASCPHLAGIVSWNRVEKSWDCPCHGSRFDCHGKLIEGPAFQDLKKLPVPDFGEPIKVEADEIHFIPETPSLSL